MKRVRLAIADDSLFIRKAIARLFFEDPDIVIVGTASTGEELIQHLESWRPDAITMDLSMPGMGGMNALDYIMRKNPIPIIVLSTHSAKDAPMTIEALNHGAVDFIDKQQYSLMDFEALRTVLKEKILHVTRTDSVADVEPLPVESPREKRRIASSIFDAVVIGASTGGPPAIERILADIGEPICLPVAVVQHMSIGFTKAFADRLNVNLQMGVHEAIHGEPFLPGHVYVAPAGSHLRITKNEMGVFLQLSQVPEDAVHKPSVDILFQSAARSFGCRTLAVLLTGMGKDGALGMAELSRIGAYTMAQDEASSVVFGMPRAALELQAVCETVSLKQIGSRLKELVETSRSAAETL